MVHCMANVCMKHVYATASDVEQFSNGVQLDNFTFGQPFVWIVANDQIWLLGGYVNGLEPCYVSWHK